MKIKVLHVITGLSTGGAEMMLLKVLSELVRDSKFSLYVISMRDHGALGEEIKALNIDVIELNMHRPLIFFQGLIRNIKNVLRIKPNIIQGWMYHANLLTVFLKYIFFNNAIVVWNIRQSITSLNQEKFTTALVIWLCAKLSRIPRVIIYNAYSSSLQHNKIGYKIKKGLIIPNGFNTKLFQKSSTSKEKFKSQLNLDQDSILVGLIARFHPMKSHGIFLGAAQLVLSKFKRVHFVLVGKDVDDSNLFLRDRIKELGLDKSITLLGNRVDIPFITASLDVSVNSSSWGEAFPNTIGEAMSCEVPCVATDIGDSARIIGDCGCIVPPYDIEALAEAIFCIISLSEHERASLGKCARLRVIENYSINKVALDYKKLYSDLILFGKTCVE